MSSVSRTPRSVGSISMNASRLAVQPDAGGWSPVLPKYAECSAEQRNWLQETGSLTKRLIGICHAAEPFSVQPVATETMRPLPDEAPVIGVLPTLHCARRDVLLRRGETTLVFAHTTTAREHLRGEWRFMAGLGARSLGSVLFADPLIERGKLHFNQIDKRHPLYHLAAPHLAVAQCATMPVPHKLWARRASFCRNGAILLVTEVFLPTLFADETT
jgi:chorismate--pyruvate lyase